MNDSMITITKEDGRLVSLLRAIDELSETVEKLIQNSGKKSGNEQYLTDKELSLLLKISRRCLQNYRTEGKIPFYRIGGKTLYKESDVEKFLDSAYTKERQ